MMGDGTNDAPALASQCAMNTEHKQLKKPETWSI
jgi:high-affinity K+ transport system ATPase subunit B